MCVFECVDKCVRVIYNTGVVVCGGGQSAGTLRKIINKAGIRGILVAEMYCILLTENLCAGCLLYMGVCVYGYHLGSCGNSSVWSEEMGVCQIRYVLCASAMDTSVGCRVRGVWPTWSR